MGDRRCEKKRMEGPSSRPCHAVRRWRWAAALGATVVLLCARLAAAQTPLTPYAINSDYVGGATMSPCVTRGASNRPSVAGAQDGTVSLWV